MNTLNINSSAGSITLVAHFLVSLSGDGAPFEKNETSTALLVGILNTKHPEASPDHNVLLFGGNSGESDPNLIRIVKEAVDEMVSHKEMTFNIHNVDIKFHLSLTPSDMKFLALLAGELTNSITDPCSYARTTQINLLSLLKSDDWQPWIFQERLEHADTVKRYKGSLTKDHKENRTKITKYIASLQSPRAYPCTWEI